MENPFVYGEVVPAAAFVNRVGRARSSGRRPGRGAEDLPHLAAPLRQVVAHPARARRHEPAAARSPSRSPSAASARTWRFSKGMPARCSRPKRNGIARATGCATRFAPPRRGPVRRPDRTSTGRLTVAFPTVAHRARRLPARAGGVRASGAARRNAPPQGRRRARRISGDRRLQRRVGRARACGRPSSISATSATCSPAPSPA